MIWKTLTKDTFLQKYNSVKMTQEEKGILSRLKTNKEMLGLRSWHSG